MFSRCRRWLGFLCGFQWCFRRCTGRGLQFSRWLLCLLRLGSGFGRCRFGRWFDRMRFRPTLWLYDRWRLRHGLGAQVGCPVGSGFLSRHRSLRQLRPSRCQCLCSGPWLCHLGRGCWLNLRRRDLCRCSGSGCASGRSRSCSRRCNRCSRSRSPQRLACGPAEIRPGLRRGAADECVEFTQRLRGPFNLRFTVANFRVL